MESVFEKYSNCIDRCQYVNYPPTSKLLINNVNKKTTFKIDEGDGFLLEKGAKYEIYGKYLHENGTPYGANSDVMLIDNFVAHLFTKIEVKNTINFSGKYNKRDRELFFRWEWSNNKFRFSVFI